MRLIIPACSPGQWAARYIQKTALAFFKSHPAQRFTLGLPTGGTVEEMYACLCQLYQTGQLDFARFTTFNMDEYAQLPPDNPQSYHAYMRTRLFDTVNIPTQEIHLLNGMAPDPHAECAAYESAIRQAGGIQLFVGGVGRNGHIAFNEPGSAFSSRTRLVELTPSTRQANARFFNHNWQAVPTHALTVGIGTVSDAQEVLILATGESKAPVLHQLAVQAPNESCPISALKLHPRATLLADRAAAQLLPENLQRELRAQAAANPAQDAQLELP